MMSLSLHARDPGAPVPRRHSLRRFLVKPRRALTGRRRRKSPGPQTPLSTPRPRPQQIINNRVKLEERGGGGGVGGGERRRSGRQPSARADGGRTRRAGSCGEEGKEEESGPGRLAPAGQETCGTSAEERLPVRRALGPQVRGEADWAGPGEQGRGQKGGGGA